MINPVPTSPWFNGMCSFSLVGGLGGILCILTQWPWLEHSHSREVPCWERWGFSRRGSQGLETKHSGAQVNLPRDAGMWSTPGFLRQRQHESLCCTPQAFSQTSTSYTLPPRLQLALAVLQREMRSALAVLLQNLLTPSPLGGNMCCGLGNILIVELHLQQSYPLPTVCFWLSDSAARRGGRAREHQNSDTALGPAEPQISVTRFVRFPRNCLMHKLGPVCFIQGNWSWVSACNFGRVGRGEKWECMTVDLN